MTNWDPKVLAAVIAAFVSVFIALYQTIARRREALEIEKLKAALDRQKEAQGVYLRRYLECVMDGKEHELTAFREILASVQMIREKIRTVGHPSYSYDPTELSRELREMAQHVANCFAANQIYFSKVNCKQAHRLKSECISLASRLSDYLADLPRGSTIALSPELGELQDSITALQRKFRESAFDAAKSFSESLKSEVGAG
jgi:hypothetical protein